MSELKKRTRTRLEALVGNELTRRGIVYEPEFPTRSGFIIDIAFPALRVAVECDGERWHKPGNKRDRFRDYILRRGGWTVIRFTEKEIVTDYCACVDRIEEVIKRLQSL